MAEQDDPRVAISWPPFESQLAVALQRIADVEHARKRWRRRSAITVVLALAAVAALASDPIRGSLLRVFEFGRERVEIVDRLPPLPERGRLSLGRRVTLEAAREIAPFPLLVPEFARVGAPDAVYVQGPPDDPQIAFLWGSEQTFMLLLTQTRLERFHTVRMRAIARKRLVVPPRFLHVNGSTGLWVEQMHEYLRVDAQGRDWFDHGRAARNVLLWNQSGVALRLEGRLSRQQALAVAATMHAE